MLAEVISHQFLPVRGLRLRSAAWLPGRLAQPAGTRVIMLAAAAGLARLAGAHVSPAIVMISFPYSAWVAVRNRLT